MVESAEKPSANPFPSTDWMVACGHLFQRWPNWISTLVCLDYCMNLFMGSYRQPFSPPSQRIGDSRGAVLSTPNAKEIKGFIVLTDRARVRKCLNESRSPQNGHTTPKSRMGTSP